MARFFLPATLYGCGCKLVVMCPLPLAGGSASGDEAGDRMPLRDDTDGAAGPPVMRLRFVDCDAVDDCCCC